MKENLWRTLSEIHEWIRFAEGKAIALLAVQGVLIALIFQVELPKSASTYQIFIVFVAVLLNFVSIICSLSTILPKTKLKGDVSPIFFGSIAEYFILPSDYYEYYKKSMSSDEMVENELCGQILVNSRVALTKYNRVSKSIRFLIAAVCCWTLLIIVKLYDWL